MDPIKNMISAADPMPNDSSAQDGEAALRRMLTEPQMFSDSLPREVSSSFVDRQRRRSVRLGGILTLAAVAVTAGLLVATNLGSVTTASAPAGSSPTLVAPTAAPTQTSTAVPGVTPSVGASVPVPTPHRAWTSTFRTQTALQSRPCTMARRAASAACARDRSPTWSWTRENSLCLTTRQRLRS